MARLLFQGACTGFGKILGWCSVSETCGEYWGSGVGEGGLEVGVRRGLGGEDGLGGVWLFCLGWGVEPWLRPWCFPVGGVVGGSLCVLQNGLFSVDAWNVCLRKVG